MLTTSSQSLHFKSMISMHFRETYVYMLFFEVSSYNNTSYTTRNLLHFLFRIKLQYLQNPGNVAQRATI
jgi:hypothetical protein